MKRIKLSQSGMIAVLAQGVLLLGCGGRGLTIGIEELGDEDSSDIQTPSPVNGEPQVPVGPTPVGPTAVDPQTPVGPTPVEGPGPASPTVAEPQVPQGPPAAEPVPGEPVAVPQNPDPTLEPPNIPVEPSQDGGTSQFLCLQNAGVTTCYAKCETSDDCPERTECIPIAVDASFCLPADDTFTPSGPSSPGANQPF